ncbi:caspase recruitment domain-containing protein 9 isoform X2 [Mirounga angustirostris]|uniref:caspase recruitment domain-containing protein 9 isoform X2 n=1 Tax=Mirounga angustirostris TaxID=9716 RepID=UPI00313B6F49
MAPLLGSPSAWEQASSGRGEEPRGGWCPGPESLQRAPERLWGWPWAMQRAWLPRGRSAVALPERAAWTTVAPPASCRKEEAVGLSSERPPGPGRRKSPTALPGTHGRAGHRPRVAAPAWVPASPHVPGGRCQWVGGGGLPAPHFRDGECRVQSRATVWGVQCSQTPPIPGALHVFPHSHQGDPGTGKAHAPGGRGAGSRAQGGLPWLSWCPRSQHQHRGGTREAAHLSWTPPAGPGLWPPLPAVLPPTTAVATAMSDYENEDQCWNALESFRVKLISIIDPSRITPYLRQCKVLNPDDEEQVLSDPNLVIRKRKVGVLLDILQRTGHKGYVAFLESLELYYPQLYKKVTGKEPTRVFSMIIDASGESGLTQLLMSEVLKLQRKVQDLTQLLSSKDDLIKELRVKDSLLRKHQERVQRLKEECEAGSRELKRCKDENYDLAMRLARQSEEKGAALMRSRDLQLEIERLKHSLMKAEDDCRVERKHTLKLRHAMEQRPSQELMWELQQEKTLLQARVRELEATLQEGKPDKSSPYIQVLEEDWRQALRDHQEQANTILSLRKDLRQGEALRARCMEEKEMFELQCLVLRKDSKMYKDRIEAILQQMAEVAIERDQAITTREELHAQHSRSLQEKDVLRKQVRELAEKADELQLQLFQREGQLLAVEGRLKRQQLDTLVLSSDLEDSSPRNSQELSLPLDLEAVQLSDKGRRRERRGAPREGAAAPQGELRELPQEARPQEDAARLEAGRGGLGEHHGQRQHRHGGLLASPARREDARPAGGAQPPRRAGGHARGLAQACSGSACGSVGNAVP